MEEMEQRVWQRVMGEKRQQEDNSLKTLAMASVEAMGACRHLQRSAVENQRELGRKLYAAEAENLACLKGLHYLQTGSPMKLPKPAPRQLDTRQLVRLYHSARRRLTEYTARSAEAEWGCIFLAMAKRQEQQCDILAQLLGNMK